MAKRPTRLTKEVIEILATYIENGNFAQDACRLADVSESGYYKWLATGRAVIAGELKMTKANSLCVELVEAIKHADAKFKAYHVSNINKASKTVWQASAWMLERRFPEEYARKNEATSVKVEGEGQVTIYLPDNGRETDLGDTVTA